MSRAPPGATEAGAVASTVWFSVRFSVPSGVSAWQSKTMSVAADAVGASTTEAVTATATAAPVLSRVNLIVLTLETLQGKCFRYR
jgi:hypothetical protein